MIHGLLWLPLLVAFFWLARQGAKEYQKIEAYRVWAEQFERAKYDIYAVLGQKDDLITWGKPTTKEMVDLKSFSLKDVENIHLLVDDKMIDTENLPQKGKAIALEFSLLEETKSVRVPFTEIPLAAQWTKFLQQELERVKATS
ncbi:hypothetical protein [Calothrix sp. PCC 6303]|uniref:hypothetical protein n=1 Tax=Calothrix sp. PCC 6303 TaxID=1170562 RepID=UPI0002A01AF7|nr:hypothetical protein [Calothrix sp. PCC 6303]AFZ00472.1 hypothetical protein Cal6303_1420 [Calothrix sp. PCC 6303]